MKPAPIALLALLFIGCGIQTDPILGDEFPDAGAGNGGGGEGGESATNGGAGGGGGFAESPDAGAPHFADAGVGADAEPDRDGCVDDEADLPPGDDTAETAGPLTFPEEGERRVEVADRIICPGDADFFTFELLRPGRVVVSYRSEAMGDVVLRLYGANLEMPERAESEGGVGTLTWPEEGLAEAGVYIVEVLAGDALARAADYVLDVQVLDEPGGCQPDERDPADDGNGGATPVTPESTLSGTLCGADEDWFVYEVDEDAGLVVTAVLTGGDPAPEPESLRVELYSTAALVAAEPVPDFTVEVGEPDVEGVRFEFISPPGALEPGEWFVRLVGAHPDRDLDYSIEF